MAPKKGSIPWNKGLKGISQPGCGAKKGSIPWNKGIPMTESTRAKLSKALKGRTSWNKGKQASDETKKKLSDAHLGQVAWCKGLSMPDEVKMKISRTKKSQKLKHSAEHKRKISESQMGEKNQFYGKRHSDETKKIISEKLKVINTSEKFIGENNPNWHDGASFKPYCHVWTDLEFKEDIKDRDSFKCQNPMCLKLTNKLCVHHIDYNKGNCHPNNLITVCISCNSRANSKRLYWTQFYNDIMFYNQRLSHEQSLLKAIRVS